MRDDTGEAPGASSQATATAGNTDCEATKNPGATSEAGTGGGKPTDRHAGGACLACGKQLCVPGVHRRRNTRRGWPPQVQCRTCNLSNDVHYTAHEKTASAATAVSDAKLQAAAQFALVTSDGGPVAPADLDGASRIETPKRNRLLAAKGPQLANA